MRILSSQSNLISDDMNTALNTRFNKCDLKSVDEKNLEINSISRVTVQQIALTFSLTLIQLFVETNR